MCVCVCVCVVFVCVMCVCVCVCVIVGVGVWVACVIENLSTPPRTNASSKQTGQISKLMTS